MRGVQLNNNVKCILKIKASSFMYNIKSKSDSTIILAIQPMKTISAHPMFTYNNRSNFIAINRLSVVGIPSINTQILHIDDLGKT